MCTVNSDAVLSIWSDLAEGLDYLHACGIIHCDIKPANILMRSSGGGAVLCDFGIAVDKPAVGGKGTPCYVPPEGLFGEWSYGGDIWALGLVMLFVTRLMALPNRGWIVRNILTDVKAGREMGDWLRVVAEIIEKIPRELSLLRQMLEDNPRNRITATDLVRGLRLLKQVEWRWRLDRVGLAIGSSAKTLIHVLSILKPGVEVKEGRANGRAKEERRGGGAEATDGIFLSKV